MLIPEEENDFARWLITMAERGHGLSPTTLKMKVSRIE